MTLKTTHAENTNATRQLAFAPATATAVCVAATATATAVLVLDATAPTDSYTDNLSQQREPLDG